mmetsp:Transcript_105661/g.264561  ORF Transcript_105661/g.264561 Transcript_105661/m.264561 type:complete len:225 (-) Transcript_105661:117-791(-)
MGSIYSCCLEDMEARLYELENGSGVAQETAAKEIADMARDGAAKRHELLEVGSLPPLLKLLKRSTPGAQEQAARALANIACSSTDASSKIGSAGAVPLLVALLDSERHPHQVSCNAARALANLACKNSDNIKRIQDAGGISGLVGLLQSSSAECRVEAAAALANIAEDSEACCAKIAESGGMVALSKAETSSTTSEEKLHSKRALVHITRRTSLRDPDGAAQRS